MTGHTAVGDRLPLTMGFPAARARLRSLAGAYWPPPGLAGAGLDQVILGRCVTAITGRFLDLVACELYHPAGQVG
jgi:hypothetical protein